MAGIENFSDALRAVHYSYTIQGQHVQGSVSKHGLTRDKTPPSLSYIDIIPKLMDLGKTSANTLPEYDRFSSLIKAANQWLSMNRKFIVVRCETIHRRMETMNITDDERMFEESRAGNKVFIRGLRLWLTPNPYPNATPQEIGMLNKVPKRMKLNVGPTLTYRAHKGQNEIVEVNHPFWLKELNSEIIRFEGFDETLERLNEDLRENPIPGSILNMDVVIHTCHSEPTASDLDPEKTYWYENENSSKRFVKIVRLFFTKGPPTYEEMGTQIFKPDTTRSRQGINPTVFKTSDDTFDKVSKWVTQQAGKTVVTIQTINTRYTDKEGQCEIFTDSMDDYETSQESRLYIETIRVFYTMSSWNPPSKPPGTIASRTFVPVRLDKRQFETMSQTLYRIAAWLKLTGLPVLTAETFQYAFYDTLVSGVQLKKPNFPNHGVTDSELVTVIRLYFPYPFKEPLPEFLPKAFPWSPLQGNRAQMYHARRSFNSGLYSSRILNEPSIEDITSVNVAYQIQTKKSPHIFFDQM